MLGTAFFFFFLGLVIRHILDKSILKDDSAGLTGNRSHNSLPMGISNIITY